MKKLTLTMILSISALTMAGPALAADGQSKDWQWSSDINKARTLALTSEQKEGKDSMYIAFDKTNSCRASLGFFAEMSDYGEDNMQDIDPIYLSDDNEWIRDLRLRIDDNNIKIIKGATMQIEDGFARLELPLHDDAGMEFLIDLAKGENLRIKHPDGIDRYSLKGSQKAILSAYDACARTAEHFNDYDNDSKYFKASQKTYDSDARYF